MKCLRYESLKKGDKVCEYGKFGDQFYILFSGRVEVQIPLDEVDKWDDEVDLDASDILQLSDCGKTIYKRLESVAILEPGDSFGEMAIMNSKARTATVKCIDTPTEFMTLWKSGIFSL